MRLRAENPDAFHTNTSLHTRIFFHEPRPGTPCFAFHRPFPGLA
jgi:hypothetical protein